MKAIRFLFFGFATLVALALITGGVAYTSWFQTWAVRRELALHPAYHASVARVDATLSQVRIEQLRIAQSGFTFSLPFVEAELPVITAARENLQIKRLVAKGWTIDLTQPAVLVTNRAAPKTNPAPSTNFSLLAKAIAADPTTSVPAIFKGVVNQLKLPVDLALDSVELEGEIILPPVPGQPPGRLKLSITGGNLGTGREGKFIFSSSTILPPAAPVSDVNATGTILAAMDTPRTFSRFDSHVDAEARGAQFPQGTRLALAATASQANAGESYTLVIDAAGRRLLGIQADFPADSGKASGLRELSGAWTLDVGSKDLAPFSLGRPVPPFAAQGTGRFEVDPTLTTFSASGRLEASGDQLGTLRPELASLGAVDLTVNFDVVQTGTALRVAGFAAQLTSGSHPVFDLRALQPFEFNPKSGELKVADPSKDLLTVQLTGVPLTWAAPLSKDFSFTGDDVRGAFLVGARNGGFAVRPAAPLVFGNLGVSQAAKPLIRDVAVALEVSLDYSPQGWQAEVAQTSVRSQGATLLTFAMKAGQLADANEPIKLAGQWNANLPGVLAQPGAARFAVLTGGRAGGDFTASLGARRELQTKLTVSELAVDPKVAAVTLPTLLLDLRADLDANGKATLSAPLVIEREGRKSDLMFAGTVVPSATGVVVDGRITSTYLVAEDAQMLALPFGGSSAPTVAPPATGEPSVAARDVVPIWNGIGGRFALALKKVLYQQKFELTDVTGNLLLESGALKLEQVRAGLGEGSELKIGAAVTFDGKIRDPYALAADLAVNDFDPVPLFRSIDPTKPPTLEGKFTAVSRIAGTGATVPQLVDHTRGDFQLSSKSGIFRGLQSDVADKVQKTTGTAAAIGGLLSAVTGKEKISDFANRAQIVADIAKSLGEIPFDQLNVAVTRDEALNFSLKDFTLISPEVRLTGTGEIHYEEGTPVVAQPLDLRLQLGSRGKLADLMGRASLLDGHQDNLGYAGFSVPFRVGGTLEKPDTNEIKTALLKAAGGSLFDLPWR